MCSALSEFFFAESQAVRQLQLLEITHPDFTSPYRLVRNAPGGIKAIHEDDNGPYLYQYVPMQIKQLGASSDLDQSIEVTFGDLGTLLPIELEQVMEANGMQTKPTVIYREYITSDIAMIDGEPVLTDPVYGPFTLEVNSIAFNKTGCVFTAKPPQMNKGRTGEVYDVARFPMLAGFL